MEVMRCNNCHEPLWLEIEEKEIYQITSDGRYIITESNFTVASGQRFSLSCGRCKQPLIQKIDWDYDENGRIILLNKNLEQQSQNRSEYKRSQQKPNETEIMRCKECGAPLHFEIAKLRDNLITADGKQLLDGHFSTNAYEICERMLCKNCGKIYKAGTEWKRNAHGWVISLCKPMLND